MDHSGRAAILALLACIAGPTLHAQPAQPGAIPFDVNNPQVQQTAREIAKRPPMPPPPGHRLVDDRTGRRQAGKASIYAPHFQGRKMADGRRFSHASNAAASKTLPLGTVAKVTNLDTGKTTTVTVEDRGPFVDGRTVDLTKASAEKIGLDSHAGVAPVVVAPIAVPQTDGSVKPGSGALPGPANQ